jgi:hypothetical protein
VSFEYAQAFFGHQDLQQLASYDRELWNFQLQGKKLSNLDIVIATLDLDRGEMGD